MRGPSPNMTSAGDASGLEEQIRTTVLTKRIRPEEFFTDYDKLRSGFVTCKNVAPNSLSFCFCLILSNLTNYKLAAFRSRTILNLVTFLSTPEYADS